MKQYFFSGKFLSAEQIRSEGQDVQRAVMEEWFYKNFEDPAEVTPWVEGEYLYIHGGPYEPDWVLQKEFMDIISEDVIQSFVDELHSRTGWEWAPTSDGVYSQHDEFSEFDEIPQNPYEDFVKNINNIETLQQSAEGFDLDTAANLLLNQMLYVGIITALEVYLSDAFLMRINENDSLFRQLVETYPKFQKQKISMSSIYANMDTINNIVQKQFTRHFNWHAMDKAEKIYKKILRIKFPKYDFISEAIKVRHTIIHRNETKLNDGSVIAYEHVKQLTVEVQKFVECIHNEMFPNIFREESEKK